MNASLNLWRELGRTSAFRLGAFSYPSTLDIKIPDDGVETSVASLPVISAVASLAAKNGREAEKLTFTY
jgi:hypothetical protein